MSVLNYLQWIIMICTWSLCNQNINELSSVPNYAGLIARVYNCWCSNIIMMYVYNTYLGISSPPQFPDGGLYSVSSLSTPRWSPAESELGSEEPWHAWTLMIGIPVPEVMCLRQTSPRLPGAVNVTKTATAVETGTHNQWRIATKICAYNSSMRWTTESSCFDFEGCGLSLALVILPFISKDVEQCWTGVGGDWPWTSSMVLCSRDLGYLDSFVDMKRGTERLRSDNKWLVITHFTVYFR